MVNSSGSEFSKQIDRVAACRITVFTRHGCHLCHVAIDLLESMRSELDFTVEKIYIDGDEKLESLYGEQVPVIHINGDRKSVV